MPTIAPILRFRCGCGKLDHLTSAELAEIRAEVSFTSGQTDVEFLAECDRQWAEGRHGLLCRDCVS